MFYEPRKKDHGLPKNPFNSLIVPRPIGWISSIDGDGEVIGVHIEDGFITTDGLIDVAKMQPLGRLGYQDYTRVDVDSLFTLNRPA